MGTAQELECPVCGFKAGYINYHQPDCGFSGYQHQLYDTKYNRIFKVYTKDDKNLPSNLDPRLEPLRTIPYVFNEYAMKAELYSCPCKGCNGVLINKSGYSMFWD